MGCLGLVVLIVPVVVFIIPSLEVICLLGYCVMIRVDDLLNQCSKVFTAALHLAIEQDRVVILKKSADDDKGYICVGIFQTSDIMRRMVNLNGDYLQCDYFLRHLFCACRLDPLPTA